MHLLLFFAIASAQTPSSEQEATRTKIERYISACQADFERGLKHHEDFYRGGKYIPDPIPPFHVSLPKEELPLATAACVGWLKGMNYQLAQPIPGVKGGQICTKGDAGCVLQESGDWVRFPTK